MANKWELPWYDGPHYLFILRGREVKLKFTYLQKVISSSKWLLKWSTEMGVRNSEFSICGDEVEEKLNSSSYLSLSFFFSQILQNFYEKKINIHKSVSPCCHSISSTIYCSSKKKKKKIYIWLISWKIDILLPV